MAFVVENVPNRAPCNPPVVIDAQTVQTNLHTNYIWYYGAYGTVAFGTIVLILLTNKERGYIVAANLEHEEKGDVPGDVKCTSRQMEPLRKSQYYVSSDTQIKGDGNR